MRVFYQPQTVDGVTAGYIEFFTDGDAEQDIPGLKSVLYDEDADGLGQLDPETHWIIDGAITTTRPNFPENLEEDRQKAMGDLEAISAAHKHGGVEVRITYAQATVSTGSYRARTSEAAFAQIAVIHQQLVNAGGLVIYETLDGKLLDVDLDTFGFFSLRVFRHHQWSDEARRSVQAQIGAASDPAALNVQDLYEAAYDDAKPTGEY